MISEQELDSTIESLVINPVNVADFFQNMTEDYPVAISWLLNEPGPLTTEEQDYLLFLGMVLLMLCADHEMPDANPERLESIDESLWEEINNDFKNAMEIQAEKVADNDVVGIFLIDGLHPDEEMPLLTGTGTLLMYSKLMALARAVGLST